MEEVQGNGWECHLNLKLKETEGNQHKVNSFGFSRQKGLFLCIYEEGAQLITELITPVPFSQTSHASSTASYVKPLGSFREPFYKTAKPAELVCKADEAEPVSEQCDGMRDPPNGPSDESSLVADVARQRMVLDAASQMHIGPHL
ncbi:uncharacterized protein HKW66_Vig0135060 [Vigna angularis]|uniref:Uncharacterized protein n=1 Tax=Phaseolus angularis TaxID=3914 RepID=A0A8T0KFV9_PHAAN|nr:uncharacterized protein HKW66_Vig0135060 [Vigna angularis]